MILPFPPHCSLKNLCSNSNNGRDMSGAKQNLDALLVVSVPCKGRIKSTILHGFGPLRRLLLPSPVWKKVRPEVPARLLPQNPESHGRWTVGCSWKKTDRGHYGSPATAKSTTWLEECRDHWVGTFEVGLICRWSYDESEVWSEVDILPRCKLDPPLYCKPAWAALFYQHLPSR